MFGKKTPPFTMFPFFLFVNSACLDRKFENFNNLQATTCARSLVENDRLEGGAEIQWVASHVHPIETAHGRLSFQQILAQQLYLVEALTVTKFLSHA